jgi:hypothetical protein
VHVDSQPGDGTTVKVTLPGEGRATAAPNPIWIPR